MPDTTATEAGIKQIITGQLEITLREALWAHDELAQILIESMHAHDLEAVLQCIMNRIKRGDHTEGDGYEGWDLYLGRNR